MAQEQRIVPADTDILCERCGYTLNGLPDPGNCPECGEPIANSTSRDGRTLSLYETDPRPFTFWKTTFQVIFQTKRFYRTLKGREATKQSRNFALVHYWIASILFSQAAWFHLIWLATSGNMTIPTNWFPYVLLICPALPFLTFFFLKGIIRLAVKLTALEAKFWGIRLPIHVVRRAMHFHAANYLGVSAVSSGYVLAHHKFRMMPDTWYLYGLCALVILSAGYLFQTYWIGMKNLMYANR